MALSGCPQAARLTPPDSTHQRRRRQWMAACLDRCGRGKTNSKQREETKARLAAAEGRPHCGRRGHTRCGRINRRWRCHAQPTDGPGLGWLPLSAARGGLQVVRKAGKLVRGRATREWRSRSPHPSQATAPQATAPGAFHGAAAVTEACDAAQLTRCEPRSGSVPPPRQSPVPAWGPPPARRQQWRS